MSSLRKEMCKRDQSIDLCCFDVKEEVFCFEKCTMIWKINKWHAISAPATEICETIESLARGSSLEIIYRLTIYYSRPVSLWNGETPIIW